MELNKFIDHTLLKPDATFDDIQKLGDERFKFNFATVCVAPCWISSVPGANTSQICTVIGFPHGNSSEDDKELQAKHAMMDGAGELDFVVNVGYIKSKQWDLVEQEIEYITPIVHYHKAISKYIVEVGYLTDDELFKVADILIKHKVDFIKTCTGYGPRNVTLEDIVKIKKHVGNAIKIKASGGIKTAEFARQLIEAGADRIGTSAGVSIMQESR